MSWRIRPDEILLEVGRVFGSKMGLQKLNLEVVGPNLPDLFYFYSRFPAVWSESMPDRIDYQLFVVAAHAGFYHDWNFQGGSSGD